MNPENDHEKEYFVKVAKPVDSLFIKKMSEGVKLEDGYVTKPCWVNKLGKNRFAIVLTEGKKHQIRRMCDALGQQTTALERVRIMNISLGNLSEGQFRPIKGKELQEFLQSVGL